MERLVSFLHCNRNVYVQDLEKDYNPKDLAKFLLGQNPKLLQQNISIQPAVNRSAFCLVKKREIKSVDRVNERAPVLPVSTTMQKSLRLQMRKSGHFHKGSFAEKY